MEIAAAPAAFVAADTEEVEVVEEADVVEVEDMLGSEMESDVVAVVASASSLEAQKSATVDGRLV